MKELVFYTREGCHLCDVAIADLERIRQVHPFRLTILDLDHDAPEEKRKAYDWEVPVVELEGRKIMKYRIDETRLVRLLGA
ncbi:MAG: glutaredoxin family protein [Polyangiaceae bacterium]